MKRINMTQEYINFIKSDEFQEISTYDDEQIANREFSFIDKMFPLTFNVSGRDSFVINIKELRESPDFDIVKSNMLISLRIFTKFFKISEEGMNKELFFELVKFRDQTLRVVKSLIYHELYTNASLFAFRLSKYRYLFGDTEGSLPIWVRELIKSIKEIEDAGYQYTEPSIFKNYGT